MFDLIRILLVFTLIILLLQRKWNLGGVMLIGAAALGMLMGLPPLGIIETALHAAAQKTTISLIIALALIMVLENILRKTDTLKKLVESFKGLIGDQRTVMALMPAIIGILPSAGGAFFSAPMVQASADGSHIKPERMSFINYWFRHIWEYISPLYPGFIMMAAITNVPMGRLFMYQAAFPATVLATGAIYGFKDIKAGESSPSRKGKRADLLNAAVSFSPIMMVMLLVMVLKVDIAIAMVIVVGGIFVYFRYPPAKIWSTLKESLSYKTLLLVMGVEIFRGVMTKSGAVDHLPQFFQQQGVPVLVIIFLLPFLVGLITGLTMAFVGVTFPMILPLIGGAHPDMPMLAFAFASGFAGLMFSPVHLCLVLTKDYFKSDLWPIFSIMLIPEGVVLAVALAQALIF